jgi:uncharacterized membrane protein
MGRRALFCCKTSSSMSLVSVIKEASLSDSWPPLYYILLHYNQALFGSSEFALRLISIISIYYAFLFYIYLLKIIFPKRSIIGLHIAFFSPFALSYSVEARGYSLFLLLTVLSFYLLINFCKNKNNNFILYSYLTIALLCTLTHYFGINDNIFPIIVSVCNNKNILKQNYITFIIFIALY